MLELSTLANGLTIATHKMPGLESAAVSLNINTGARHETEAENGLAHLFEHMVFKGTRRRSARDIAEQIEDVGGSLNAWTSRDHTVFHARVLTSDIPLAVDIVSDLVTEPRFDRIDLEHERKVVLSEIGEALDTPDDLVFDELQATAFPDQSIGRAVLGTAESLAELTEDNLHNWLQHQYHAPSIILSAAGAVEHQQIVEQAEALLGALPTNTNNPPAPARWVGGTRANVQDNEQTHIAVAFEGPASTDPMQHAALLFSTAMGGGMSSRLFQELREQRGLAYSVTASFGSHIDTGLLSLYIATQHKNATEALNRLREIAHETAANLQQEELDRARAQLKAGLLIGLEGAYGRAEWIGRSLLTYGRVLSTEELIQNLESVDLETARSIGSHMLESPEALAIVGPNAEQRVV